MDAKKSGNNPYFRKTVAALKNDKDESMICALMFHVNVLQEAVNKRNDHMNIEEECNALMSKLFFEKLDMYPKDKHVSRMDEDYAWPVSVLPSEVFRNHALTSVPRKCAFFKSLKVGDVLAGKITAVTPLAYILKVLYKYGCKRVLEDLDIEVTMDRAQTDSILGKTLSKEEYCKVVVSDIQKGNEKKALKTFVSVSDGFLPDNQPKRKLGQIKKEELPFFVINPSEPCYPLNYAEYLRSSPAFHNHLLASKLYTDFGIDINKNYSFCPAFANMRCEEEYTGQATLKKSKSRDITKYLQNAMMARQKGEFAKALNYVDLAVELKPDLSESYQIRSAIHEDMEKPRISISAYLDVCQVYHFDKESDFAKGRLSKLLFLAARKFYKSKKYAKAAELCQAVLEVDKNYTNASAMLEYLKNKHPEAFLDSDENTLQALKEGLVAQLKKLH